jgi:hypothetical protein
MQALTVPVGYLHWWKHPEFSGANTTKTITAKPALLLNELFPESLFIRVTLIVRSGGRTVLD